MSIQIFMYFLSHSGMTTAWNPYRGAVLNWSVMWVSAVDDDQNDDIATRDDDEQELASACSIEEEEELQLMSTILRDQG